MAAFPPLPQIVGNHGSVYEAYYSQADPSGSGSIGAFDAAKFLKKSGLKETVLSQIWDLSDPSGKGYLEKSGFFVALKLISLSQNGQDVSNTKLTYETPPPNLGPVDIAPPVAPSQGIPSAQWAVTSSEKMKYDQLFDGLQPVNNLVSGDKVKPVLINSKLPVDALGRIWDLSDIDKDGYLDREEFAVAMHLVYRALENEPVPNALPNQVIPPSKRKKPAGGVQVLPGIPGSGSGSGRNTPTGAGRGESPNTTLSGKWVVSVTEKVTYDAMFKKADTDMKGYVTGQEIREIFLQSGLQNTLLAHIWTLCDIKSTGKLNSEQFALAMYLVQQKIKGIEPPTQLTPEMVPPSMRSKPGADPATFGVADVTNAGPYSHVADFSAIKQLDVVAKEIDDIKREKMHLEKDKAQREADIKICNGEVQTLQKEFDAITGTLHQLETQKQEAQKRLDELDDKRSKLEASVKDIKDKCDDEQKQIDDMKSQINNQERTVREQEDELNVLRAELNSLRDEEQKLEQNVESGKQQLESLVKSQKDVQLQLTQTRTRVQHLQDQQRALAQSMASHGGPLHVNGDIPANLSTGNLGDLEIISNRATRGSSPVSTVSSFSGSTVDDLKEDPFKGKDPFGGVGGVSDVPQSDPFLNEDPFKGSDPFKSEGGFTSDPFGSDDPFKEAFGSGAASSSSSKKSDPFGSADPFGNAFSSSSGKKADPFDPFGGGGGASSAGEVTASKNTGGDLFGSDPFAPKPIGGSQSPKPALPPKQKKQPPPRPAPPKVRPSPSPSPSFGKSATEKPSDPFGNDPFAGSDPFANTSSSGDPFANFADFNPNKFEEDKSAWGTSH